MKSEFTKELESLINRHSVENESDTPDFVLAAYLRSCLTAFNDAVAQREMQAAYDRRAVRQHAAR